MHDPINKVPRKKGYVPNMYTGRSMMVEEPT